MPRFLSPTGTPRSTPKSTPKISRTPSSRRRADDSTQEGSETSGSDASSMHAREPRAFRFDSVDKDKVVRRKKLTEPSPKNDAALSPKNLNTRSAHGKGKLSVETSVVTPKQTPRSTPKKTPRSALKKSKTPVASDGTSPKKSPRSRPRLGGATPTPKKSSTSPRRLRFSPTKKRQETPSVALSRTPTLTRRKGNKGGYDEPTPKSSNGSIHPRCQSSVVTGVTRPRPARHLTPAVSHLTPKGRGNSRYWFMRKPFFNEDVVEETKTRQRLVDTSAVRQHRWLLEAQMAIKQAQGHSVPHVDDDKPENEASLQVSMAHDTEYGDTTYDYDDWNGTTKSGITTMNDDEVSVTSLEILFNWMTCRDVEYGPHPRVLAEIEMARDLEAEKNPPPPADPLGMVVKANTSDDSGIVAKPPAEVEM